MKFLFGLIVSFSLMCLPLQAEETHQEKAAKFKALSNEYKSEKDPVKKAELRKELTAAYREFMASTHKQYGNTKGHLNRPATTKGAAKPATTKGAWANNYKATKGTKAKKDEAKKADASATSTNSSSASNASATGQANRRPAASAPDVGEFQRSRDGVR